MANDCKSCSTNNTHRRDAHSKSFISAFLILILPKCSICVMAYSSAIALCGGDFFYHQSNNWVSYIPLFLAVSICLMILGNWRGQRSYFALLLAISGTVLIVLAHQLILTSIFYDIGTALLFLGIWFNSNLLHVIQWLREYFKNESKYA